MNLDSLASVLVEYNHPERDARVRSVGLLRDGSQHILLIHEIVGQADLYSYTIIPRGLINKITNLRLKDQ
jgi:hypothetical protein